MGVLVWFALATARAQAPATPATKPQQLADAVKVEPGATCLDAERLIEHISGWLGGSELAQPLSIQVHGSPHFSRVVWFRIERANTTLAERRFEPAPARCEDLHAAVALAVALAVRASLLDVVIGAPVSTDQARGWQFGVEALAGFAVMPGAVFGADLRLQRALSRSVAARATLLGLVGPFGDFSHESGGFVSWLFAGRLDLCATLLGSHRARFDLCVGAAAGGLYAVGSAFPESRSALTPYIAVANALELNFELAPRWSLTAALDVFVPLKRTTFVVRDEAGNVVNSHDLAAAGALLSVGPAYQF
jgi:hypothetical protein